MKSLSIAATGMVAQQQNVEVISNNIANMNTTAYQRRRPEFQDLLYQNLRRVGSTSADDGSVVPTGIQLGMGVKLAAVYRIHEQGNLMATDNTLDIAIQGKGFFQIQLPSGETGFSRDGTLQLSPDGDIVTHDGYLLEPNINIPTNAVDVTVNASGEVQYSTAGNTASQSAGTLQLAIFPNDAGLQAMGQNYYLESAASGSPTTGNPGSSGFGTLLQGFLETANVNPVSEITNLISAQRAYEMNSKVITTSDEMMRAASNLK